MMTKRVLPFLCFVLLSLSTMAQNAGASSFANEMEETMHSSGLINVVLGVLVIIMLLFFAYLIRLDKKIARLEDEFGD